MKFLLYTQFFKPEIGAPQVRLAALVKELRRHEHAVEVVTSMPNYPAARVLKEYRGKLFSRERLDGVQVYRSWLLTIQSSGLTRLLCYFSFQLLSFPLLLWRIFRLRPDYLLVESPPLFLGATAIILKKVVSLRFIFLVADKWPDCAAELGTVSRDGLFFKLASALERAIYRNAAYITLVQPGHLAQVVSQGADVARVVHLPNGAYPVSTAEQKARCTGIPSPLEMLLTTKMTVVYAGNHGRAHGLEVVLDTAAAMRFDERVHFIFIGAGSEKQALMARTERMRLRNVSFFEPVSTEVIQAVFQESTLVLAVMNHPDPAVRSAKIFPMMASGTPLVYIGADDAANILEQYEAAAVIRERSPEKIVAVLQSLLENPEEIERMTAKAKKCIATDFNWSIIVENWLKSIRAENTEHPV